MNKSGRQTRHLERPGAVQHARFGGIFVPHKESCQYPKLSYVYEAFEFQFFSEPYSNPSKSHELSSHEMFILTKVI